MIVSTTPVRPPAAAGRTTLDEKVLDVFEPGKVVVHKGVAHLSEQFRRLPRFVADYLVASLVDPKQLTIGSIP